jgi:hypothetical protein
MILVPLFDLKFLASFWDEFAASAAGTSDRRYQALRAGFGNLI